MKHPISALSPEFEEARLRESFVECDEQILPKIKLRLVGNPTAERQIQISVSDPNFKGHLTVLSGPGLTKLDIKSQGPIFLNIAFWRDSTAQIADHSTINCARVVCDNCDLKIGRDCLWSDEILVQTNDQHGIWQKSDKSLATISGAL